MIAVDNITDRELQVAELISKTKTNRQICDALCISMHTCSRHIRSLFDKIPSGEDHPRVTIARWYMERE